MRTHLVTLRQEGEEWWRAVCSCGAESASPVKGWPAAERARDSFQAIEHRMSRYEASH